MDAHQVAQVLCEKLRDEIRKQNISVVNVDDVHDVWVRLHGPGGATLEVRCDAKFWLRENRGNTQGGLQTRGVSEPPRRGIGGPPETWDEMWRFAMQWLAEQRRYAPSA
jgi:hypothetical protein